MSNRFFSLNRRVTFSHLFFFQARFRLIFHRICSLILLIVINSFSGTDVQSHFYVTSSIRGLLDEIRSFRLTSPTEQLCFQFVFKPTHSPNNCKSNYRRLLSQSYKATQLSFLHFLFSFSRSTSVPFCHWLCFLMSENNRTNKMNQMKLGSDKTAIVISSASIAAAEKRNKFIVIGRPVNPQRQHLPSLIKYLPRSWNLEVMVHGSIIPNHRFQFLLPTAESLDFVLSRASWRFQERMVVIHRWAPGFNMASLDYLPIWIQIRGIPFHLLDEVVIGEIASKIDENSKVLDVDMRVDASYNGNFVRVCMNWFIHSPIEEERTFQFSPGVDTVLRIKFEKLRRYCNACGLITHDTGACPNRPANGPPHALSDDDQDGSPNHSQDPRIGQVAASELDMMHDNNPYGIHDAGSDDMPPGFRSHFGEAEYQNFLRARAQYLHHEEILSPIRSLPQNRQFGVEDHNEISQETLEYQQEDLASNESDLQSSLTSGSVTQEMPQDRFVLQSRASGIGLQTMDGDTEMDFCGKRKRSDVVIEEGSTSRMVRGRSVGDTADDTEEREMPINIREDDVGVCGSVDPNQPDSA